MYVSLPDSTHWSDGWYAQHCPQGRKCKGPPKVSYKLLPCLLPALLLPAPIIQHGYLATIYKRRISSMVHWGKTRRVWQCRNTNVILNDGGGSDDSCSIKYLQGTSLMKSYATLQVELSSYAISKSNPTHVFSKGNFLWLKCWHEQISD